MGGHAASVGAVSLVASAEHSEADDETVQGLLPWGTRLHPECGLAIMRG